MQVGHFLFDGLFAVFRALQLFDRASAVPDDLQLVFATTCAETCRRWYAPANPGVNLTLCDNADLCRFKQSHLPVVSSRPYLEKGVAQLEGTPVLCFKAVMAGIGGYALHNPDPTSLRLFLNGVLDRLVPAWKEARAQHYRHVLEGSAPLRVLGCMKRWDGAPP